jgi:hypothetical protein
LLQQVNNQLVHDFLSQQNNRLFLFLSELYLWLAETSQQPISQTTWLKVTPIVTIVTIVTSINSVMLASSESGTAGTSNRKKSVIANDE